MQQTLIVRAFDLYDGASAYFSNENLKNGFTEVSIISSSLILKHSEAIFLIRSNIKTILKIFEFA